MPIGKLKHPPEWYRQYLHDLFMENGLYNERIDIPEKCHVVASPEGGAWVQIWVRVHSDEENE